MSTPPHGASMAPRMPGAKMRRGEPADVVSEHDEPVTTHQPGRGKGQLEPSAAEVAEALLLTTQALKATGRTCTEECGPEMRSISLPRGRVLMVMDDAGEGRVRMGDLSAALGVTPRNVTTIVDGLEREGLIVRKPDPTDRRAILLELTAKGREHIAGVHALHRAVAERFFAPLNAEERCMLLRLLRKIREAAGIRVL
jgi:DNA-binding MarR family transcriptional regulator